MTMLIDTILGQMLLKSDQMMLFNKIWLEVFSDTEFKKQILDWVRWEQLYKEGVDETGSIIGTYSAYTEWINPEKQEGTPYTLYDTGEFYESMIITVMEGEFEIDADPIKTDQDGNVTDLFKEYGEEIIGITDETKEKLIEELKERFVAASERIFHIN